MNATYKLRKNRDFQYVYRRGKSVSEKGIVLIQVPSRELKVGFCVSKRVGNSVVRNRTKRRMREAFRSILPGVRPAKIVIVARAGILKLSYWEIRRQIMQALKRHSLLTEEVK